MPLMSEDSGRGLVLPAPSRLEGDMKIRITEAGVGKVILMRSDWPEGKVLIVSKNDGDMFVREGWGEFVKDEPAPEEPQAEEKAEEAEEAEEPKAETATAEPTGEQATRKPPRRRRGG